MATARWVDTAFPHRWNNLRHAIGERQLLEAEEAIERREFDQAIHLYRAGVARSPHNASGRIGLAQLYVLYRRPDLAKVVLTDQITNFADNEAHLRTALQFLLEFHFDAELATACEKLLAQPTLAGRPLVALFAATVAYHRGNYDHAETLLFANGLDHSTEGALLQARMDLERDFPELALLRLEDLIRRDAATDDAYILIGQIRRRLGQIRAVALNATLRLTSNPLSHAPRIDFLYLYHEQKQSSELAQEVESYFNHFSNNPNALLALGDFAANTGRPQLVQRIEKIFTANAWSLEAPALMAAEATIVAGEYAEGLSLVRQYTQRNPQWTTQFAPVFASLQAVALFGMGRADDARLHLDHLLTLSNLRADNLNAVATRLMALGFAPHARTILTRAVEIDRLNQNSLTTLVRLEAEGRHFDTLPKLVRQLMEMRRPSRDVLNLVYRQFGSDLHLFHPEQTAIMVEVRDSIARATAAASVKR
ncbi:MAG: tetratricopeptide repeat protein [Candidatus Didemnitutus sp.]|nr:tetratricopeptide repeat protein [Candidatus Didemnitutus sp.]